MYSSGVPFLLVTLPSSGPPPACGLRRPLMSNVRQCRGEYVLPHGRVGRAVRSPLVQLSARAVGLNSAVYLRIAGANNSIVGDAKVFLTRPWIRRRLAMGPYSMDLRERVAAVIDEGEGSQRQVDTRFRVSVSFVTRLLQRRRDAGTLAPTPHGGGPPR